MGGLNRVLLAEWLFNAEMELREAQSALRRQEPNARARYLAAKLDLKEALMVAKKSKRLASFCISLSSLESENRRK